MKNALEGFLPETAKVFARLCDDLPLNVRQGRAKLEKLGVTDIPKQAVTDTERAEPYALQCKNLWQRYEKTPPISSKAVILVSERGVLWAFRLKRRRKINAPACDMRTLQALYGCSFTFWQKAESL